MNKITRSETITFGVGDPHTLNPAGRVNAKVNMAPFTWIQHPTDKL